MAFPSWSSAFGSSSMPSIADSFSGKFDFGKTLGLDSSKELGGIGKGGKMALPFALAAASAIPSFFGANAANQTRASVAQGQLDQAAFDPVWRTQLGREGLKANYSADLGNRIASATFVPDLELGRQREAAMFAAGPLAEREQALDFERARRTLDLSESALARESRQRENRERLKRIAAEKQSYLSGFLGPIAPQIA